MRDSYGLKIYGVRARETIMVLYSRLMAFFGKFSPRCIIVLLVAVVSVLLSLGLGARAIAPKDIILALFSEPHNDRAQQISSVIWDLRIPRTIIGIIVGIGLGLCGGLIQGLTRNPLADPATLGLSPGAGLAIALGVVVFHLSSPWQLVWFAFLGAAVAIIIVYGVSLLSSASRQRAVPRNNVARLLLSGVAIGSVFSGLTFILQTSNVAIYNRLRFLLIGALDSQRLTVALQLLPFLLIGAIMCFLIAKSLNALELGEDTAASLGHSLKKVWVSSFIAIVLLAGAATAIAGPIAFIGLMVPYIVRGFAGVNWFKIFGFSLLISPIIILLADTAGRLLAPPGEIPLGIMTSFLGAPLLVGIAISQGGKL